MPVTDSELTWTSFGFGCHDAHDLFWFFVTSAPLRRPPSRAHIALAQRSERHRGEQAATQHFCSALVLSAQPTNEKPQPLPYRPIRCVLRFEVWRMSWRQCKSK